MVELAKSQLSNWGKSASKRQNQISLRANPGNFRRDL